MRGKKSTYIRKIFNIIINILFISVVLGVGFGVYSIIYYVLCKVPNINALYGTLISVSVTMILAFISYIAKIKKYIPLLLYKFKQVFYQFLSLEHNPLSIFAIINYNKNYLSETEDQGKFISSAIQILKNNLQNIILISGRAGRGKTTSVMLLLNAIAHDKELYLVFSDLQNHIIYFDSVNDMVALLEYLNNTKKQSCKLVIIDNIQKCTISSINEVMKKVNILADRNQDANKKTLFVFLYQETDKNGGLYNYVKNKFFQEEVNIFKFKHNISNITKKSHRRYLKQAQELESHISKIDDSFFQRYMQNVLYNRKNDSIVLFMNSLMFSKDVKISSNTERTLFILTAAIFMGFYNGYITRKELHNIWCEKYSFFSLLLENILIRYYVRNKVFTPFPFGRSAYIFNEQIAKEYRKRLIHNEFYQNSSCIIAQNIFLQCKETLPQKWLLFLLCSTKYCMEFSQEKRIHYFENALSEYHLLYILDLIESEISILPEKEPIFRQELGIIYIYNGEWEKAKQILYPYVQNHNINKDIWHIQLKIIEAEHGGSDQNYLEMLTCMENECTDPIIIFQIRYWREHIHMEHGKFSLTTWDELVREITSNDILEPLRKDEHFSIRIISDYERTYFLKGDIDYSRYNQIISEYIRLYKINGKNITPIESILSRAYYIQYDILYQLGIWGFIKYGGIDPDIIRNPVLTESDNCMVDLLYEAQDIYDFCIRKYQSEGIKKYRTLEVRKAELTLYSDSNHFIEILNKYGEFQDYVNENNITVFDGYCNTQKGKAFALYADYMFRKEDLGRFEEYLNSAEEFLRQAQTIYQKFGNSYGSFRAELLSILVQMVKSRNHSSQLYIDSNDYCKSYSHTLSNLTQKYNSKQQFIREHTIIEYLQSNISRIDIPLRILRFYPIILQ